MPAGDSAACRPPPEGVPNAAFLPATETGTDGITVSYAYDAFGRLGSVNTIAIDTTFSYVACGTCFPGDAVYYAHADHSDGSDEYEYFDALNCVFQLMPVTDSGACRSPIPVHAGHPFRSMPVGV